MKKITQNQLNKLMEEHERWLMNVVSEIYEVHRLNLSKKDLSGLDFSGLDLSHANLVGANLSKADLSNTNSKGVNLAYATGNGKEVKDTVVGEKYLVWTKDIAWLDNMWFTKKEVNDDILCDGDSWWYLHKDRLKELGVI